MFFVQWYIDLMSGAIYNVESIFVVWIDGWGTKSCVELKPAAPQTSSGPHGLKSPAGPGVAHILHDFNKFSQTNCDTGIYACTINCNIGTLSCVFLSVAKFQLMVPFGSQGHLKFKGSESGKTGAIHRILCISMAKKCDLMRKSPKTLKKSKSPFTVLYGFPQK